MYYKAVPCGILKTNYNADLCVYWWNYHHMIVVFVAHPCRSNCSSARVIIVKLCSASWFAVMLRTGNYQKVIVHSKMLICLKEWIDIIWVMDKLMKFLIVMPHGQHGILLVSWLFVQQLVQVDNKEKSNIPITSPSKEGNPPVTSGFPSQRANNVDSISMSWQIIFYLLNCI